MTDRAERTGRQASTWLRAALALLGAAVVLCGFVAWALETEYGGWDEADLGHAVVGYDEATGRAAVYASDGGAVLFEADSLAEVDAWIEDQRTRNYTVPTLLIAGGGVLVLVGVMPFPFRKKDSPAGADK